MKTETKTVEAALADLKAAMAANLLQAVTAQLSNGHARVVKIRYAAPTTAKRPYKRTPAGRARQAAAMRKYWKARRAAKKVKRGQ